jgi:hypothetical protein
VTAAQPVLYEIGRSAEEDDHATVSDGTKSG